VNRAGVILYFTNQVRQNIDFSGWGPKTTTPGGNALKFYASVRLDIKRIGTNRVGPEGHQVAVSNKTQITVAKNKVAPPFAQCEVTIRFGEGIARSDELLELGQKYGFIEAKGGGYYYGPTPSSPGGGEIYGQGKETVVKFLKEHGDVASILEGKIREGLHL